LTETIAIGGGPVVRLDGRSMTDWEAFHDASKRVFGFFDGYGRNMNAWIDCMTDLDQANGMTRMQVRTGECLTIVIDNAGELRSRAPEIFRAIEECSAFVNWRRMGQGAPSVIALAYWH
jgi:RNAse (barnase) inhibitor barstar